MPLFSSRATNVFGRNPLVGSWNGPILSFLFPSTIVKKKKLDPSPSFSFPLFAGTELGRDDGEGAREEGQTILGVIDGGAGG